MQGLHQLWDTDIQSGLLDFSPPENYLKELNPQSGKLSPKRLTYDAMWSAVEMAHNGVVLGQWSLKNMKDYLRVHGLNAEAVSAICECANNCRTYNSMKAASEGDPASLHLMAIQWEWQLNPELFQMWKFTTLWVHDGVQFYQHIDVAMHLIFCGVIKQWFIWCRSGLRCKEKVWTFLSILMELLSWSKNWDWIGAVARHTKMAN